MSAATPAAIGRMPADATASTIGEEEMPC